ncbi:DUF3054 domain-containing protein [Corynebacterium bovis]|uniref:DUF3054 domain-containing protein n=1 Tax=Corynebacterium bovis TaxID=36808 RepID=UPI0031395B5F
MSESAQPDHPDRTDHPARPARTDRTGTPDAAAPTLLTAGLSRGAAVAADVIAVLVFALLARIAHNSPELPLSVGGWISTAWPFVLGTLIAWGLLAAGVLRPARGTVVLIWLSTVGVGLVVWGIRHTQVPHWSFMIVAAVTSAILLFGWRLISARLHRRP